MQEPYPRGQRTICRRWTVSCICVSLAYHCREASGRCWRWYVNRDEGDSSRLSESACHVTSARPTPRERPGEEGKRRRDPSLPRSQRPGRIGSNSSCAGRSCWWPDDTGMHINIMLDNKVMTRSVCPYLLCIPLKLFRNYVYFLPIS